MYTHVYIKVHSAIQTFTYKKYKYLQAWLDQNSTTMMLRNLLWQLSMLSNSSVNYYDVEKLALVAFHAVQ
jgi:hypothetical protein